MRKNLYDSAAQTQFIKVIDFSVRIAGKMSDYDSLTEASKVAV
jgi:hypothetical protein